MPKSILLTGSTGFVGTNLVKSLTLKSDYIVKSAVRHAVNKDDGLLFEVGDINASTDFGLALNNVTVVVHCAARAHVANHATVDSLAQFRAVNTEGTLNLAQQAANAGVKRFVFVSSIGVNGTSTSDKPFTSYGKVQPHNAYAQSKYEGELGLKKIAEETGLEVVIVRPTLVYGPRAPGNFGMLTKLVKKLPVLPFGLANNRRDFISVQNLADLLIACATHPKAAGHTFLASDSETVSIKQFVNAIAKGLGKTVFQLPVPVSLMRLAGKLVGKPDMIEQLYGNLEVDSSNIKEVLGWTPPYTMEQSMALLKHSDK
ncbi:NAD-dependent epimerase/dehydratase family protein [Vibrio cholerae]|uniref:UDP-glucose 4-epimerase family protein n=1 Tax=Vibrio cholerae TaxID=666 RepID=UPI00036F5C60|nr:SDR family oxidoreductase [Vibrio cholerae]EGQ7979702.1 SDR family oxidoreductase [Vibrio cholerae]EGQ8531306.1 NAD-dependent epimerase/dehydratase family protein [Vibrio cholerae]EGQ8559089.1 NAD-dependent epimerase/dehydratase family protein [Vibrio cholerae]EJL6343312.1 SDR family oxidoreductase [Vibrio cholerae]KFE26922.1 3-beta hydroxysteroid dehydrogenase/isomerase family protein [Vibrio cholerae]